jgi:beta-galactosidase GanA
VDLANTTASPPPWFSHKYPQSLPVTADGVRHFYRAGVPADFRLSTDDLSGYRLVVAPMQYLLSDCGASNLDGYVQTGGRLVLSCLSGIVDENDHVRPGSYPGAFSRPPPPCRRKAGPNCFSVLCAEADVLPLVPDLPADVEVVRRSKDGTDWTFCINHGSDDVRLPLSGVEILSGEDVDGDLGLEAGAVAVVRSRHSVSAGQ